ncbi:MULTISPECIES: LysR family transcriptional regulator [Pseudomonas]|nr:MULTISPECIES: LysR family transcriptional regulator [Pseudomonas]AZE99954.1 Transcriptional regulator, LysR family [Pseudomonas orientalis]MCK3833615.1 LysR family transcriptional regulator [Pseudomonas fluorescens]MCK3851621.1 LysR family transcriptional regulator [Pseudomonas sp. W2Jun17]UEH06777.1 LysR family transcriptional regulator [Pseudomonas sp. HN8-3]
MDRLRAIEIFIKSADLGSFYKAAAVLGITPQAVSKAVRQLEAELGLPLFRRSRRSSSLTEEGRTFLERTRGGVAALASAWEQTRQATASDQGLIRLTAPLSLCKNLMLPLIKSFQQAHPDVEFDLVAEDRYTDIVSAGIDVGFRSGFSPEGQLVVRELMRLQLIACASPDYLDQHGVPATRMDLVNHECIGSRRPNTGRVIPWEFNVDGIAEYEPVHVSFCTNDVGTELQAALAGMGIGMIDGIIAAPYLRSGELVPLFCSSISERYAIFLYHAHQPDMPRRVQRFIEHAAQYIKQQADSFRFDEKQLSALHLGYVKEL